MYPHQTDFENWCRAAENLSDKSIDNANYCLNLLFTYGRVNFSSVDVNDITSSDIRDYLLQLREKESLSITTVNKYISYFKKYFYFLAVAGITPTYRMLDLKGFTFDRQKTFVVGWPDRLAELIPYIHHPDTLWLLALTTLGYESKELLSLTWSDVKDQLSDDLVKKQLENSLTKDEGSPDPYIFASRSGKPYASTNNVMQHVKADKNLLAPMPLTLTNVRISFVYSLISKQEYSDIELMKKLHLNSKSLAYYQFYATKSNLIPFDLERLKKQNENNRWLLYYQFAKIGYNI